MATPQIVRKNRTGIASAKKLAAEMVEATGEFEPTSEGSARAIAGVRALYVGDSEPTGSIPLPSTKGLAKSAIQLLKGESPMQLVDKLGERLAFERTGVRLYETILVKFDAANDVGGVVERAALESILADELAHFQLLREAIVKVGGDPTALTPSANLHATLTKGVLAAVADPRTTFSECLEAATLIELLDNECWDALVELVELAGDDTLAEEFRQAAADEVRHLENIRGWVAIAQGRADPATPRNV